ncbi:hypothetical protein TNCV_1022771 [Trichonephila clavipes]|nr:hypothetical protein TNCV_1022771 [Trichonephila clavipes]
MTSSVSTWRLGVKWSRSRAQALDKYNNKTGYQSTSQGVDRGVPPLVLPVGGRREIKYLPLTISDPLSTNYNFLHGKRTFIFPALLESFAKKMWFFRKNFALSQRITATCMSSSPSSPNRYKLQLGILFSKERDETGFRFGGRIISRNLSIRGQPQHNTDESPMTGKLVNFPCNPFHFTVTHRSVR